MKWAIEAHEFPHSVIILARPEYKDDNDKVEEEEEEEMRGDIDIDIDEEGTIDTLDCVIDELVSVVEILFKKLTVTPIKTFVWNGKFVELQRGKSNVYAPRE